MKLINYVALIVVALFLVVGCSQPEVETPAPVEPAPVATPVTPVEEVMVEEPVEVELESEETSTFTEADQSAIDRWTASCKNGNVGLCSTLKNRYNIDMQPDKKRSTAFDNVATGDGAAVTSEAETSDKMAEDDSMEDTAEKSSEEAADAKEST